MYVYGNCNNVKVAFNNLWIRWRIQHFHNQILNDRLNVEMICDRQKVRRVYMCLITDFQYENDKNQCVWFLWSLDIHIGWLLFF